MYRAGAAADGFIHLGFPMVMLLVSISMNPVVPSAIRFSASENPPFASETSLALGLVTLILVVEVRY